MIKPTFPSGTLSPLALVGFLLAVLPFALWGQVNLTNLKARSGFIELVVDQIHNPPLDGSIYVSEEVIANEVVTIGTNEIFQACGYTYFRDETASGPNVIADPLITLGTGDEYRGSTWDYFFSSSPILIFGPAEIRLIGRWSGNLQYHYDPWVIKGILRANYLIFSTESESQYIPSNAVVIPEDATGSVEIIMESSTDLINWAQANPGTYDSSHQRRFFRLRAVRN
jgi:hypothetical protein